MADDDELTRSEQRAAKRRARDEAAKSMPFWAKTTIILGIVALGVGGLVIVLSGKPPQYTVYDTQVSRGVTAYSVRVPEVEDGDLLEIAEDIYSKHSGATTVSVRFECSFAPSSPFDPVYLGGITIDKDGSYHLQTAKNADCN